MILRPSALAAACLAFAVAFAPLDASWRVTLYHALLAGAALCLACQARWPARRWPGVAGVAARAGRVLAFAVLALAGWGLVLGLADKALAAWTCALQTPFISEIMEGREVIKAQMVAAAENIYTPLDRYPLLITLYGPLYYLASAAAGWLVGPGLPALRMVSAACGVGLGLVTALTARRLGAGPLMSVAAGGMLLASPILDYATHARPDTLAWLTLFAGAICLHRALEKPQRFGAFALWAVAFFTLAALTKQQTWAFIAAGAAFALWRPETRPLGWRVAAGLGLCVGLGVGAAQWATGGEFLRQTLTFPRLMSGLSSSNSFAYVAERFGQFGVMHAGLVLAAGWSLWVRRLRPLGLYEAMFLVGLASTVMSLRWWGASVNHFMGVMVFALAWAAAYWSGLARPGRYAVLALWLALCIPAHFALSPPSGADPCGVFAQRADVAALRSVLSALPGRVIMDAEGAYVFLGTELFSRLDIYDAFETDVYDRVGLWSLSGSRLGQDIRGRAAKAFVDSKVFKSETLTELVSAYYRKTATIGRYTVHTPRPDAAILALASLTQAKVSDGAATLKVPQASGLKSWGNYVQPAADTQPGSLTLEVAADAPLGRVRLAAFPRLTAPGQRVEVAVEDGQGGAVPLAAWDYQGPPPGTGWESRREAAFNACGPTARIRFTLTGAAQLWFTKDRPMYVITGASD